MHVVERDEDRLAPRVHLDHGLEQRIDHEMRAEVLHAVELGAVRLDAVEHAVDDRGDALLQLLDPPRRERRHQQAADAGMLLAVHLGDELRVHELVELLPAGTARHLRGEGLGVGEHAVHVGVAADHHLRRALAAAHRTAAAAPIRPCGDVRVGLELGAAKIDVDDVALVQICR